MENARVHSNSNIISLPFFKKTVPSKNDEEYKSGQSADKLENDEECFEACIFNCAYAENQAATEPEVNTYRSKKVGNRRQMERPSKNAGGTMIEDVYSISSSGSESKDDVSLLDLDLDSASSSYQSLDLDADLGPRIKQGNCEPKARVRN